MRGFPRARITSTTTGDRDTRGGAALSVTLALREQAEAATTTSQRAPEVAASRARPRKGAPARPSVVGRPSTPDESPLAHAPAAGRLDEPPLRTTLARCDKTPIAHRSNRRRVELGAPAGSRVSDPTARPRPSRVLAELHAALADEAAAAE